MLIKRSAFLLLTGVLAQQACTVENTEHVPGDGSDAGTGTSGGSASSNAGAPNDGGSAMAAAGNDAVGGAAGGADGAVGGASAGGDTGSVGGAAGSAGAGGAGVLAVCDDSVGTPASCADICTDPTWCDGFATNLQPRIAELAVACLAEGTNCDDFTYECVRTALGEACEVPDNDYLCASAVEACAPNEDIDAAGCHRLVDGLNDAGLAQIHSCVEDGCSFGLWSCVESLQ